MIGNCFSLLTVYFASKFHRFTWVCALIAITINGSLYYDQSIWGHFLLDIFYAVTSIIGWQHWNSSPKPKRLSLEKSIAVVLGLFLLTFFLSAALISLQGNAIAFDAFGTSCAIIAQLLTCFAYCESWSLWVLHDIMNLAIDVNRQLWFHGCKEVIYLYLAYQGWKKWDSLLDEQAKT